MRPAASAVSSVVSSVAIASTAPASSASAVGRIGGRRGRRAHRRHKPAARRCRRRRRASCRPASSCARQLHWRRARARAAPQPYHARAVARHAQPAVPRHAVVTRTHAAAAAADRRDHARDRVAVQLPLQRALVAVRDRPSGGGARAHLTHDATGARVVQLHGAVAVAADDAARARARRQHARCGARRGGRTRSRSRRAPSAAVRRQTRSCCAAAAGQGDNAADRRARDVAVLRASRRVETRRRVAASRT